VNVAYENTKQNGKDRTVDKNDLTISFICTAVQNVKSHLDSILHNLSPKDFIDSDPISIPKRFTTKEDIEISAFFAATLAWGQRKTIITNANKLMHWMGEEPHRFILDHSNAELKQFEKFVHRTFNATDALYFIEVLKHWYTDGKSLEDYFSGETMKEKIANFHLAFFGNDFVSERTRKHVANPAKNSSAKRLNMYLRWMVRNDGLDFGIWTSIQPSELKCPLDVHVQRAAFHFGLLTRKQQDWKAVEELSDNLLLLDSVDPIKYDLALFKWSEAKMD
jgi:uncharacterized protein (TIGR02757 family)